MAADDTLRCIEDAMIDGMARDAIIRIRLQEERSMLDVIRITASGSAADTPEAAAIIREIRAACVALDDAPEPYRPGLANRAARRAAASRSRRR